MLTPSKKIIAVNEPAIHVIRGQRVMLDSDLADLYQVTTGNLNLAVRRNLDRFPKDFMQPGGVQELEIANCNLKFRLRWSSLPAVRLHRARCSQCSHPCWAAIAPYR